MLFTDKNCSNCNSKYDEAQHTCPVCGAPNEEPETQKISKAVTMLSWKKQIIISMIGMFLLSILSTIVIFVFALFTGVDPKEVDTITLLVTNIICYSLVFIAMIIVLLKDWKNILQSAKGWQPYVWALAGTVVLFGVGFGLSQLKDLALQGTNQNQSNANDMIASAPVLSIIVMGFLGPICEELTYRVGAFSFLRRINRPLAWIGSVLAFALCHVSFDAFMSLDAVEILPELIAIPIYIVLGCILTFIYEKKGFTASALAHISYNILNIIVALCIK